jgi:asparaginyl-tRNA synthetase
MKRTRIQSITSELLGKTITICGWVRTVRDQKNFAFVEINDGSTLAGFQIIMEGDTKDLTTGASVRVKGTVATSPGGKQKLELKASHVEILGLCPADEYPLQKKRHSFEFLRTIAHLRPRTNTQGAVQRVRNQLAFATHEFFQQHGFLYVQTPIISSSDAEGGGQQFNVTALPLAKLPKLQDGAVDYSQDFFHRPTYLTVSGQLEGEAMACALSDIYTFGPTFRAENSNTSRHLAEFWMIEPEMAFADLKDNMELAENYLKFIIQSVLKKCSADLEFFDNFVEKGLIARLQHVATSPFAHLTYTEAVEILKKSGKTFEYPVEWGTDLQSEHERYLAEEHCKKPVILTDYPAKIKAFYMRMNPDEKTVAAMDVLVPKIGEIIGGSQREDRLDLLKERILAQGLKLEEYDWYLQLRRFGSVPHAGFGAGFERLVLFVTGMENIRDVIPFPRYPGHAEF